MAANTTMSLRTAATRAAAAVKRPVVAAKTCHRAPALRSRVIRTPATFPRRTRSAPRVDATLYTLRDLSPMWPDSDALHDTPSRVRMSDLLGTTGQRGVDPSSWTAAAPSKTPGRNVPCDVLMRDTEYVIWAELPGCGEEDVTVQVENHVLTLSAPPLAATADEAAGSDVSERVVMSERGRRGSSRTFRIPKDVDEDGIHCAMDKGVLTVVLPRVPPKPTGRTIAVTKGKPKAETAAATAASDE